MKNKKRLFTFLSIFALFIAGFATVFDGSSVVQAGTACKAMGSGMDMRNPIRTDGMINSDKGPRKWTVEELFKDSARFTSYYGEGEGGWLLSEKVDRGERSSLWDDETVQNNITDPNIRNLMRCYTSFLETAPGNIMLSISSGITWITKVVMGGLFAGNIFGTGKGMIDIVGIIGGSNAGDKGILGTLTNSIYTPLVVIAFVIMATNIIWKGLMRRQFREAINDIIWSFGAFIIGVMLMYNPQMLAGAPQKITTEITNCLVAGLNGESCFSNAPSEKPSMLVGTECLSSVGNDKKGVDMLTNGLTCGIWKSFVMEPWAQAQFGHSYKDLYTANAPAGGSIWDGLEGDGNQYCVSMGTSKPASSFDGKTVVVDQGPTVCNVAVYQMYLSSDVKDNVNHKGDFPSPGAEYDDRWFDIIAPMAKDESNWYRWAGVYQGPIRAFSSLTGMIGTIAAAALLIVLGLMGMGYQIASTLMMAFAPLFFLIAIVPNRGKKIFLGWLEVVVSSILKYMATALFAVVALVLYSAVLANATGMTALVGVLVLSGTMFAYRKEVVNIIGAANMGGQKLSNQFEKVGKKASRIGSAAAGGAIGSKMAGGSLTEGASASVTRQLKRGTNVTAQMLSQHSRTKSEMLRKNKDIDEEKSYKERLDEELGSVVGLSEEDKQYVKDRRAAEEDNSKKPGEQEVEQEVETSQEVEVKDNRKKKGVIDPVELAKLDKLKEHSDADLMKLLDEEGIDEDSEEYTMLVSELNRRVTLDGDESTPMSQNIHADPAKLSNPQLQSNIRKFRDDFYTEGTNYEALERSMRVYDSRNGIDEGVTNKNLEDINAKRERIESGVEPIPKRTTPTDEELRTELRGKDKDDNEGGSGGTGSPGSPATPSGPRGPRDPDSGTVNPTMPDLDVELPDIDEIDSSKSPNVDSDKPKIREVESDNDRLSRDERKADSSSQAKSTSSPKMPDIDSVKGKEIKEPSAPKDSHVEPRKVESPKMPDIEPDSRPQVDPVDNEPNLPDVEPNMPSVEEQLSHDTRKENLDSEPSDNRKGPKLPDLD